MPPTRAQGANPLGPEFGERYGGVFPNQGVGAEICRMDLGQPAAPLAHCSPDGVDDVRLSHRLRLRPRSFIGRTGTTPGASTDESATAY